MRTWFGTTPGAVHYYALDLPGNNVNGLFNGSGSVTHRYYYTPWGQAQSTSEATHNPLRYASRELDATTGLYCNRARWYDPYLGRFISEDPIGIDGGINVYAYAGNDPVNYTDPFGLSACPGPNCLEPITVVGRARPRGWLRRRWDETLGMRRWGGLSEGRGPTSIVGDGIVISNADDEMDLLEELLESQENEAGRETVEESCGRDAYRRAAHQGGRNGLIKGTAVGTVAGAVIGGTGGAVTFGTLGTLITPGVGTAIGAVGGGVKGALVFAPVGAVLLGATGGILGIGSGLIDQGVNCLVAKYQAR